MFATAVRFMAKKGKPKMKPIELKTPPEQTQTITRTIFDIVKEHGPLTISDTWQHLKEKHGYKAMFMVEDGATDLEAKRPSGADLFICYGGVKLRKSVAAKAD